MKPFLLSWCQSENVTPPDEMLGLKLAGLMKERMRRYAEAPEMVEYFLRDPVIFDEKGMKKFWKAETPAHLSKLIVELEKLENKELQMFLS